MTRRRLTWSLPALTCAAALALTGCTDDADGDGSATSASPGTVASASPSSSDAASAPAPTDDPSASPGSTESASPDDDADGAASPSASAPADVDPTTGALAAIAQAAAEAGGTPYGIDTEAGNWQVDVAVDRASVEVTVDPTGTEVLGTRDDDLDAEDRTALGEATVQLPEAIQRVVSSTGGTLREADLDADAPVHWNVSVTVEGAEQEHDVDAATGEVTQDADD